MSLITIVQNAFNRTLLFDKPSSVIGNNAPEVRQALQLLDALGRKLMKRHAWAILRKEQSIDSADFSTGSATLATVFSDGDFDRLVPMTEWDATNYRQLVPTNAQEWQFLQNAFGTTIGIEKAIYRRGSSLYINPTPPSGETYKAEYISNFWRTDSGGAGISAFTADTDLVAFDDDVMEEGLALYMKKENGMPYTVDWTEFWENIDLDFAQESPKRKLSPPRRVGKPYVNIPETNVGL